MVRRDGIIVYRVWHHGIVDHVPGEARRGRRVGIAGEHEGWTDVLSNRLGGNNDANVRHVARHRGHDLR